MSRIRRIHPLDAKGRLARARRRDRTVPKFDPLPTPEPFTAEDHARWADYGKAVEAAKALPHLDLGNPWVSQNARELDLLPKRSKRPRQREDDATGITRRSTHGARPNSGHTDRSGTGRGGRR